MYQKLNTLWQTHRADILDSLRLFERQVLLFPILVVLSVAITFLFGGHITAAHWWLPTLAILTYPYFTPSPTKAKYLTTAAFLSLLLCIWVISGIILTVGWMDTMVYHLPAIRMMIEGWNPVWQGTGEKIAEAMELNPWHMCLWHVISMTKTTWMFSAAAYFFTGTPLNLLFPLFPFLFIATTAQLLRFMRNTPSIAKIIAIILLWTITPSSTFSIADTAIALGAISLLCGIGCFIRERRTHWLSLIVSSFWLMTAKPTGLWTAFVFWVCFSLYLLWMQRAEFKRSLLKLIGVASLLTFLLCITCASPYLSSWFNYGHPFYPKYTVDEERFPIHNFTADFNMRNDDAKQMGHIGYFVNAYISETLAHKYYKWKLNKDTFAPRQSTWSQGGDNGFDSGSPTSPKFRLIISLTFLFILLFGHKPERILGGMMLLACLALPTTMIGYVRYTPWITFVQLLAVCTIASIPFSKIKATALVTLILLQSTTLLKEGLVFAAKIDQAHTAQQILKNPPAQIITYYSGGLKMKTLGERYKLFPENTSGNPFYTSTNNVLLLKKQLPQLKASALSTLELFACEERDAYPTFPSGEFKLPKDYDPTQYSLFAANAQNHNRKERLLRYPILILKSYTVLLPKLIAHRLQNYAPKESL